MRGVGSGTPTSILPFLLLLLCFLSESSRGQAFEPRRSDPTVGIWRTTRFDNLRGRGIYDISGGRDQRVWFATSAGVASYDGLTWESWSIDDGLLDERAISVLELSDGSVIAGGRTGLTRYADGRWTPILGDYGGPFWGADSLVEARDGSVWVATRWGALRLRGGRRTLHCTATVRKALLPFHLELEFEIIPDGMLLKSSWGVSIGLRLSGRGEGWLIIAVAENSEAEKAGVAIGDRMLAIRKAPDSTPEKLIFLVTCMKGDGQVLEVRIPRREHEGTLQVFQPATLAEGPNGRIYFGARRGAVYCFDPSVEEGGNAWSTIVPDDGNGLPARVTACSDGSVWAMSGNLDSIVRIDSDERETLPRPTAKEVERLIGIEDGSMWALSDGRLYSTQGNGWRAHAGPNSRSTPQELLAQAPGVLWIADRQAGLTRIEIGTERLESYEGLRFLCRTTEGADWFQVKDGELLERSGESWTHRPVPNFFKGSVVDGIGLAGGGLLVYETAQGRVVMARWSDGGWQREVVPDISVVSLKSGLLCQGADGRIWLGPGHDNVPRTGILVCEGGIWRFLPSLLIKGVAADILPTEDGSVWLGTSRGLYRVFGEVIEEVILPWRPAGGGVSALCTDADGRLWVGGTARGSYRLENGEWRRFYSELRPRNHVMDLQCTDDGALWAATHAGLCRLDGSEWRLVQPWFRTDGVRMLPASGGSLWIHDYWNVIRYRPETIPPETWLNSANSPKALPGPMYLAWGGRDRWRPKGQDEMTWSYRIDGGEWSPFSAETRHVVEELGVGTHRLEVRSRDCSFNIDPTPAFTTVEIIPITPPVWRRTWFLLLVGAFLITVVVQTVRMSRRDRRLRDTHARAEAAEAAKKRIEAEVAARIEAEEARRELETELIQSRKMEAIGQLAGGIAHDFNNILTAIWGNASELSHLLEKHPYRDSRATLALEGIHTAADRAAALTRQLLMVGQRQVARPEVLDPNAIIETMGRMLERVLEEHVRLELLLSEDAGSILVDRSMFEQVIMNLVVNARDAMPGGGRIFVRTEEVVLDEKDVAPHPGCEPGPHVKLCIEDEGEGMSEETMARAFDPFFTTKPTGKGTGLGLSTVFAIARQCRGFVTVSSKLSVGSCFEVYFPSTVDLPRMMPGTKRLTQESKGGSETILVCEDDPNVRDFVDRALEHCGYEVLTASSGEDALDLAASYEGPVALLLTDVIMPGINGRELAESIRECRPEISVLYMSGHAVDVLADRSELREDIDLLQKPFTMEILLDRVRASLEGGTESG